MTCCAAVQDMALPNALHPVTAAMVPMYPRNVNTIFAATSGSGAALDLLRRRVFDLCDVKGGQVAGVP